MYNRVPNLIAMGPARDGVAAASPSWVRFIVLVALGLYGGEFVDGDAYLIWISTPFDGLSLLPPLRRLGRAPPELSLSDGTVPQ